MSPPRLLPRLKRAWTWALGELPPADPDPRSDQLTALLASIAALALFFGTKHKIGNPALSDDTWALLIFGVMPLAVAVGWHLKGRGVWLLGAGVTVTATTIGWRIWGDGVRQQLLSRPWLLLPSTLAALGLLLAAAWRGGVDLRRWGLGRGDTRWWAPRLAVGLAGVIICVCVAAAASPAMLDYYPKSALARGSVMGLIEAQIYVAIYLIGWEFLFRGFLLFGLARRDSLLAVFFQAIPFFLMHRGKPALEMFSSFVGGVGLGWFTLRARSLWPAVLLHCALSSLMEVLAYAVRAWAG